MHVVSPVMVTQTLHEGNPFSHAAQEAEVVTHLATAAVPDLGEALHLPCVGLLHNFLRREKAIHRVAYESGHGLVEMGSLGGSSMVLCKGVGNDEGASREDGPSVSN